PSAFLVSRPPLNARREGASHHPLRYLHALDAPEAATANFPLAGGGVVLAKIKRPFFPLDLELFGSALELVGERRLSFRELSSHLHERVIALVEQVHERSFAVWARFHVLLEPLFGGVLLAQVLVGGVYHRLRRLEADALPLDAARDELAEDAGGFALQLLVEVDVDVLYLHLARDHVEAPLPRRADRAEARAMVAFEQELVGQ